MIATSIMSMLGKKYRVVRPQPNPETVRAFFAGNTENDLAVPVAVAEQVRDEAMRRMSTQAMSGDDLARHQGMVMAVERFEQLYYAAVDEFRKPDKKKKAGGHA